MTQQRLVIATGNPGKLREIRALLADLPVELLTDPRVDMSSVEETGATFVENALLKARYAAAQTGLGALADDSGLVVDALDGAPGIYSARYAGEGAGSEANNARLLRELEGVEPDRRTAHFFCVIVVLRHALDPAPLICEGRWQGHIVHTQRGDGGFGYDPLFVPTDSSVTSAQLSAQEKNRVSHRGIAIARLRTTLGDFLASARQAHS